jgi:site-specific recombinase XerD
MEGHTLEKKLFSELIEDYDVALKDYGLSVRSRLQHVERSMAIVKRHEAVGEKYWNPQIAADYVCELCDRSCRGEIKEDYAQAMRRMTERFIYFIKTGEIRPQQNRKGAQALLLPEFQSIADGFLGSEDFHPNTRNDMRWVAHKYFEWLTTQGFRSLRGVGAIQIQKFMLFCSETMAMGSVHNVRIYLKKLYEYLYRSGKSESPYTALLSFKVNRESKVPQVHQAAELAAILETIDRKTVSGKRAYAAMLLGIVLGLRACDVAALKLTDIDWVNGEIKLLQSKTTNTVVLPLTKDVGEALRDYILNARPNVDSLQVFCSLNPPHRGLKTAVTIGEIYRDCCKAAGLPVSKKFHTLRRSLGTSMLASGTPVTTVAQVLGHAEVESTKKYIAVDTEHLKFCALSFDGIKPKKGARK